MTNPQFENELFIQNRIGTLNVKRERQRKMVESTDAEITYWTEKLAAVRASSPQQQLPLTKK